jgi:VWFA-related protein
MAALQAPQEPTIFHSGTRLVEVEVVVRDQPIRPPGVGEWFKWVFDSGPPFGPPGLLHEGLTKEDFTLLDQGKPQQIAVFRAGASNEKLTVLPPGAVSNRVDSLGQPLNGATAVLIDFLNNPWSDTEYVRLGMTNFLRSLTEADSRIALYTLGVNLHVLKDFTDPPQKLMEAAAMLDRPQGKLPPDLAGALRDYGYPPTAPQDPQTVAGAHGQATSKALKLIVQQLARLPGRKSLVWLMPSPKVVAVNSSGIALPSPFMAILQQANIVLYPVRVRCPTPDCQDLARAEAAFTGGRAFFDAMDLPAAVRTAEADPRSTYTLGYYPDENALDGKYHKITVHLRKNASDKQTFETNYRTGYLATKAAVPPPAPTPEELFKSRLNSSAIGIVAQAMPEALHGNSQPVLDSQPVLYDVRVTVDLHDIHLEPKDGHFIGAFDLSVPIPSAKGMVKTVNVAVDLTDRQLAAALENSGVITLTGVEAESGEIRVVVRDRATGLGGSLRVPVAK